jgi:hypothetical protein
MKHKLIAVVLAAFLEIVLLASDIARAANSNWINPGVGIWFDGMNWNNPPWNGGAGDTTFINNGGTAQYVTVIPGIDLLEVGTNASANTGHLRVFGGPSVMFHVDDVQIGDSLGVGTLEVSGGAQFISLDAASIGRTASTSSSAVITGSGSKWDAQHPQLLVNGNLEVNNLATLTGEEVSIGVNGRLTLASSATVTLTNRIVNSGLVQVGSGGTGAILTANLINDGTLRFNHTSSYVHLSPISSTGTIQHMNVGSTTISDVANFTGNVTVSGGTLILQNTLNAGGYTVNSGTLRFENATTLLSHPTASITSHFSAEYLGSTITGGFLRGIGIHRVVPGNISRFNGVKSDAPVRIIQDGTASFDLFTNGGTLTSNGLSTLTSSINTASGKIIANGVVEVADFLNSGVLTINSGSTLYNFGTNLVNGGGSRTTVNPGGVINLNAGGSTQIDLNGALLVNNGTITGGAVNVYYGSLAKGTGMYGVVNVFDGGIYAPGNSPGISTAAAVTFDNAPFTTGGPALQIEIAGTTAGTQYDRLNVTGQLSLAGTLQVALTDGFSPAAGNSFDILNWSTLSGTFAALQLPALGGGLSWTTSALYTTGVLSVAAAPGLPGNFNNDGSVDAADYVMWRKTGSPPDGYNTWRTNFGQSFGSGASATESTSVPEPTSVALLLFGLATCAAVQLRRPRVRRTT